MPCEWILRTVPPSSGGKEGAQEACSGIRGGVIGMLIRRWDQRSGPGNLHSRDDHLLEWPLPGLCHIRSLKDIVRDPEPNPESPALVLILDLDLWSFIHEMILVQDSSFIRRLWVSLAWAPVQWVQILARPPRLFITGGGGWALIWEPYICNFTDTICSTERGGGGGKELFLGVSCRWEMRI